MTALMFAAMNDSVEAAKYLVAEAGFRTAEERLPLCLQFITMQRNVELLRGEKITSPTELETEL